MRNAHVIAKIRKAISRLARLCRGTEEKHEDGCHLNASKAFEGKASGTEILRLKGRYWGTCIQSQALGLGMQSTIRRAQSLRDQ